jgi:hypothetical protein
LKSPELLAKTDTGGGAAGGGGGKGVAKAPTAITARGSALLIPVGWNGGWWIGPNGPALGDAVNQFNKVRFESREVAIARSGPASAAASSTG